MVVGPEAVLKIMGLSENQNPLDYFIPCNAASGLFHTGISISSFVIR
jgi:hypothetical protein